MSQVPSILSRVQQNFKNLDSGLTISFTKPGHRGHTELFSEVLEISSHVHKPLLGGQANNPQQCATWDIQGTSLQADPHPP